MGAFIVTALTAQTQKVFMTSEPSRRSSSKVKYVCTMHSASSYTFSAPWQRLTQLSTTFNLHVLDNVPIIATIKTRMPSKRRRVLRTVARTAQCQSSKACQNPATRCSNTTLSARSLTSSRRCSGRTLCGRSRAVRGAFGPGGAVRRTCTLFMRPSGLEQHANHRVHTQRGVGLCAFPRRAPCVHPLLLPLKLLFWMRVTVIKAFKLSSM
jgi:hypothetical protein